MHLELHGIAWVGEELDDGSEDEGPLFLPLAIDAQDGASVVVENVWISKLATAALRASGGARIVVRDDDWAKPSTASWHRATAAIIVENCLFNGGHVLGVSAYRGGRVDVRSCSIDCCFVVGSVSRKETARTSASTRCGTYRARKTMMIKRGGARRFVVRLGGCVTFSATENETYRWVPATFEGIPLEDGSRAMEAGGSWTASKTSRAMSLEPVLSLRRCPRGNMIVSSHVRRRSSTRSASSVLVRVSKLGGIY